MPLELAKPFTDVTTAQEIRLSDAILHGHAGAIGQIFKEWDATPPHLKNTVANVLNTLTHKLRVNFSETDISIITAAANLAAEENKNPYHGNTHFLKVFTLSALLGADAFKDNRLDAHRFCILLSAALIHDYRHDGTTNKGERYRLEDISLNAAKATLQSAGATDDDWALFQAFIHATDVSKDFSNPTALSPAETLKIYSISKNKDDLPPELNILADTETADIALMLEDADLSSGLLDVQLSITSGQALAAEQGREYDITKEKFFFEHICHKQMFSISGQRLIQPLMDETLKKFNVQPIPQGMTVFPV